ncbi:trehalose-6-phosphate synthase [Candidatus Micrarchaeota archaeon]|nr:MAG: trehalose-6-phosphate synthase [Candidatus Micrarchaeota archaeon]
MGGVNRKEKLRRIVKDKINDRQLLVLSYREPYTHYYEAGEIKHRKNTGGLVAALDPVMKACGGTWIACGETEADREAVDKEDKVCVPFDGDDYDLRRIWLSKEERNAFIRGVSNRALWPLMHFVYVRPYFDEEQWKVYRKMNKRFAEAAIQEAKEKNAFIWIQDYHLALCAKYIKDEMPDAVVAQFWHIPWPSSEIFRIFPWHRELTEGLLANDLLGFHIRYYSNNFMDSVDRSVEARVERENSSIFYNDHETKVREFPISVDDKTIEKMSKETTHNDIDILKKEYGIGDEKIIASISRMDYTKGISEQFMAYDKFLENNPKYLKKVVLVQVISPSRTEIPEYQDLEEKASHLAFELNWKYGDGRWRPIVLINEFIDQKVLVAIYKMAEVFIVNSLQDGMNIVCKEYAAAKQDGDGTLILSKFTGASRELDSAILVNPFSENEVSEAFKKALEMPKKERRKRLKRMREVVRENDVYNWAGKFIEKLGRIEAQVSK